MLGTALHVREKGEYPYCTSTYYVDNLYLICSKQHYSIVWLYHAWRCTVGPKAINVASLFEDIQTFFFYLVCRLLQSNLIIGTPARDWTLEIIIFIWACRITLPQKNEVRILIHTFILKIYGPLEFSIHLYRDAIFLVTNNAVQYCMEQFAHYSNTLHGRLLAI